MPLERIKPVGRRSCGRLFQKQVGPGTGRHQHGFGANVEARAGHVVPCAAAFDLAAAHKKLFRRNIIGDRRAIGVGIHQILQRDAFGAVHLGVVIFEGALKAIACQNRLTRQRVLWRDPTVAGQPLARIFQPVAV